MSFVGLHNDTCNIYTLVESVDAETGEQVFSKQLLKLVLIIITVIFIPDISFSKLNLLLI